MNSIGLYERDDTIRRLLGALDVEWTEPDRGQPDILVLDEPLAGSVFYMQGGIVLLNTDMPAPVLDCHGSMVVSYGLESHNTVTRSSVDAEEQRLAFGYCLQRDIAAPDGRLIECMDVPVHILGQGVELHEALCAVTAALLCGLKIQGKLEFSLPALSLK